MAVVRCDFYSEVLDLSTSMTAILPERAPSRVGSPAAGHPTLYLLHGLSDDNTMWLRRTSIERYVAPLGLAVVMPEVHRSFYTDEAYGSRYWTFLSAELPELAGTLFRLSGRRQDTFVAGLSMGGYGALKWGLRQPDRFAAVASLSAATDAVRRQREAGRPEDPRLFVRVFGDRPVAGTGDDLHWLVEQAPPGAVPPLYVSCGTEDDLYAENVAFVDACRANGITPTVDFGPGEHDWAYWDRQIQEVLRWLPLASDG